MPARSSTGKRIKHAREEMSLSTAQLASRIGIHRKTLECWENGGSEPRGYKLMKLAGVCQVPMIWLLTGQEPQISISRSGAGEAVTQKLERALVMQQHLAAILVEISTDVTRLQRKLDEDPDLAA